MKIAVISDTHDRIPNVEKAVEIFNRREVAAVLHCGDFVAPFSVLPFTKLKSPLFAVFGNNDGEREGLTALFQKNGWTLNQRPWRFEFRAKRIVMLHEPAKLDQYVQEGSADLVVYGHTHEKQFRKSNGMMIVNPGEGCGWVKGVASIALVDFQSLEAEFIDL